jgi:hypothetical protein
MMPQQRSAQLVFHGMNLLGEAGLRGVATLRRCGEAAAVHCRMKILDLLQ